MSVKSICEKIISGADATFDDIVCLLKSGRKELACLQKYAVDVRNLYVGNAVHLRGLIEFSNICTCDCRYCGIRKSNCNVSRYTMSKESILNSARYSYENGYGSVVLQSGERRDAQFTEFVADVVSEIKRIGNGALGITLSCGEQSEETFKMWKSSGADRYLLRIETTDEELFARLHPGSDLDKRKAALENLKSLGYITGTGVMVGLPGQSVEMLARDVLYFKALDADMIGLGPYVTHCDALLDEFGDDCDARRQERLEMSYRMISVCRLVLKNVNIAASTALSALDAENGRLNGLLSGANVIMPNTGDAEKRKEYYLYSNKPDTGEPLEQIRRSVAGADCTLELFTQGNPPR